MIWRHRIILTSACFALACLASACGNKAEVQRAKRSVYDTDFSVVYNAVLDATRDLYPNITDNPGSGAIKTAWHQVSYANNQDDMSSNRSLSTGGTGNLATSPAAGQAGMPTRLAYKRFFIRFDVLVAGGRPWRVQVVGHASEWEPGAALPVELVGAARPPWLDGRTDGLTVAIYKKMKRFAIAMKDEPPPVKPEDLIPKTDPKAFANVPPEAAKRLAALKDAVQRRSTRWRGSSAASARAPTRRCCARAAIRWRGSGSSCSSCAMRGRCPRSSRRSDPRGGCLRGRLSHSARTGARRARGARGVRRVPPRRDPRRGRAADRSRDRAGARAVGSRDGELARPRGR
jgi:hypothetical protein